MWINAQGVSPAEDVRWLATHAASETVKVHGVGHSRLLQDRQVIRHLVSASTAGPGYEQDIS